MKYLLITLPFFLLLSCAQESGDSQVDADSTPQKTVNKKKSHLLSDHEKALQKAKDVEKELKKADDKRRKALGDG